MTAGIEALAARLDKFPRFVSNDGSHWLRTSGSDSLCVEAAAALRSQAARIAELERHMIVVAVALRGIAGEAHDAARSAKP